MNIQDSDVLIWRQVTEKFISACKSMWTTLACPEVWRPCLYMYLSLALSINIYQGMFYWLTDATDGPSFSKVFVFPPYTSHLPTQNI